jgi:aspartyl-tRNA(Asn)/glutamyl-tRNA(Gln) amidotransferase subunit B
MALKVGLALNCRIAGETWFSRKTYFYPDLAKNFQITQYEVPLAERGWLEVGKKRIRITRVHMEEDPAKLIHIGGIGGKYVLVDYNRSGVPLVEIVTEPDFKSPAEARLFLQKLENILEYLGVYDSTSRAVFKSDANISLEGGERVEVKNITGTKEIEQALKFEIMRQRNMREKGIRVVRETRMWDPNLRSTQSLRTKEEEADYGYIMEPDLTSIELKAKDVEKVRKGLPELPDQKLERLVREYRISGKMAESLTSELELAEMFERHSGKLNPRMLASWITGPLKKTLNWNGVKFRESGVKESWVLEAVLMFVEGKLTDRNAEILIRKLVEEKRPPKELAGKYGLGKVKIDLEKVCKRVLDRNPKAVLDYRKGEEKALHFLVGQAMAETKGKVDAGEIRKVVLRLV